MKKISSLLKYLYTFGQISEYRYLREVYAQELPEEFLKKYFPYAYSIYQSEGIKPAKAYINMLNQIKAKFEIEVESDVDQFIKNQEASSFSDIVNLLKLKKEEIKSSEEDFYKDTGIPEDKTSELKMLGASKEEILFILDEETRGNHSIEDAASDLAYILKERNYIRSKGVSDLEVVTDFEYLDDASEYFINLANKIRFANNEISNNSVKDRLLRYYRYIYDGEIDPDHDYSDYKGIELGGAKANSKIIGKVGDYTIVFSNSMEAAQYWERGAVEIEDGDAHFGLCTSRIYQEDFRRENLYANYKYYFMFQFIKNFSGEPKFNNEISNPNDLITVCFDIEMGSALVMWGDSKTVNSENEDIYMSDFEKCFASSEEAQKALDTCISLITSEFKEEIVISMFHDFEKDDEDRLCKAIMDIDIENFLSYFSPDEILTRNIHLLKCVRDFIESNPEVKMSFEKGISPEAFFKNSLEDTIEFGHLTAEMAERLIENENIMTFFDLSLQNLPECKHLTEKAARMILPNNFFHYNLQNNPDCKNLVADKAKALDADSFFSFYLQNNPELKSISIEKSKDLHSNEFFDKYKLHELPEYRHVIREVAKNAYASFFFSDGLQYIPECKPFIEEKCRQLSLDEFFKYKVQNLPECEHLVRERAKAVNIITLLEFKAYESPACKDIFLEKVQYLGAGFFFYYGLQYVPECKYLIAEKAKELSERDFFFKYKLQYFPECKRLLLEKIKNLNISSLLSDDVYSLPESKDILVEKAEKLTPEDFFSYVLDNVPECKHLIAEKAKKLSPDSFFGFGLEDDPECEHLVEEKRKSLNND